MLNGAPDKYAELLDILGPDGLQAMQDAGVLDLRLAQSNQQMGQGGKLIDMGAEQAKTPGAKGMTVGPHGVYIASSPLEHAAVAMSRIMGQKKMEEGRAQQDKATAAQTKAMADLIEGQKRLMYGMKLQGQPMLGPEEAPMYGPGY